MKSFNSDNTKWWGWGDADISFEIATRPSLLKYLAKRFDVQKLAPPFEEQIEKVELPESRLQSALVERLKKALGEQVVSVSNSDRIRHAFGKSYKDLIRVRSLKISTAPDVVFFVKNEEQIKTIFELAKEMRMALVPFGGGTSVVGGVEASAPDFPYLGTINLTGMKRILRIDEVSLTATIEAGKFGPELEAELNAKGYTLGHFPQSFEYSTLGGWIAARSSGQNSLYYGGIDKLTVSLNVLTPKGEIKTVCSPAHACGPDLKQILVGNEGILGIILSATMKIHRLPEEKLYFMFVMPSFKAASFACRQLVQSGVTPALIRISDEAESEATLSMGHSSSGPVHQFLSTSVKKYFAFRGLPLNGPLSLVLVGLEGTSSENKTNKALVNEVLAKNGGIALGEAAGKKWLKDRFFLPYLRDDLLDNGLFVETLETATTWSNLGALYEGVRTAITDVCKKEGLSVVVMTHISHLYHEGASLYFSIVAQQRKGKPLEQWQDIKAAANEAIKLHGGVISHHHGVGVDHRNHLPWDETSFALVRSIKKELDPDGLLNPGKVIPP